MSDKKYTWKDLKEFVNSIPENELPNEVIWWGEERGGSLSNAYMLTEDYVRTDYGCEPASVQEYEEGEDEYPVALLKGTPILSVD